MSLNEKLLSRYTRMSSVGSVGAFSLGSAGSTERLESDENDNWDLLSSTSYTSLSEIQEQISAVRRTILETEVNTDQRKAIVHKLIKLKIKEQDLENRRFYQSPGEVETLRHSLVPINQAFPSRRYCEECGSVVWPVLQTIYECKTCTHVLHAQCLSRISRKCVGAWLHPLEDETDISPFDGQLSYTICPEISLVEQSYECAECSSTFYPSGGHRLCDYLGKWYCQDCHWGYTSPVPARILNNWDFSPKQVCQATYQYLNLMRRRAVIDLEKMSPSLSIISAELSAIIQQRQSVLEMKKYLMVCRVASSLKLLRMLEERQHFVENEFMYSFQDLLDIDNGSLSAWLGQILETWQDHILSCILCRAKGFVCELCSEKEDLLFPFSPGTETCPECNATFHRNCDECPRCQRIRERSKIRSKEDQ
eukprot:TRINITY_DN11380_c1_g1_i7.p1 TRINITY_DN11380_c1_g1~~TRINITY_DN11380_c1_g1_i7.p1  ORF type:complete len:422 (-),score=39.57 TRINITY_DN11380_c1_g1_i7:16-1281(-)